MGNSSEKGTKEQKEEYHIHTVEIGKPRTKVKFNTTKILKQLPIAGKNKPESSLSTIPEKSYISNLKISDDISTTNFTTHIHNPISEKEKDDLANYTPLKTIGKGTFGKVLLVKSKNDQNFYALKCIKKSQILEKKCITQIKTEKKVLEKLDHPFIVKLYSTFQTADKIFMLLEYSNGGDMFFHLQRKRRFSEECAKFYGVQLYLALSFLHSNNILYRDLKPENIMLDKNGNLKLIDFGLVKDKFNNSEKPVNTVCGTSEYLRKIN